MNPNTLNPQHAVELFSKEQVEAVLIGGLAAVLLGAPFVTNDMHFCYDPSPDNRSRLIRALASLHPYFRVAGLTDEDARALPFTWDERTLRDSLNLTLQTDAGPLDLVSAVPGVGDYAQVRAAAIGIRLNDIPMMVLDLPALVAGKRATGRAKDLLALPHIEMALRMRDEES